MTNKKANKEKNDKSNEITATVDGTESTASSSSSFTAFTSLRKSFKRLKRKKDQRAHSVDSILDGNKEESKDIKGEKSNQNEVPKKSEENQQNLLKRIASGKKFRILNKQSKNVSNKPDDHKFDVIEWSSCESLTENFEKRMRKHNSLRRSKASLLMPVSGKANKISPPSTKITRYSSMNNILETKLKTEIGKLHSSQNMTLEEIPSSKDSPVLDSNSNVSQVDTVDSSVVDKRKRTRSKNSMSLPNICEEKTIREPAKVKNESSNDITKKDEEHVLKNFLSCSDIKPEQKLQLFLGVNKKRCSLIILDGDNQFYGSSPFLNRPPVPSAPKPTTRRDRILRRCVSTEGLNAKKRKAECASTKCHKRALSDCQFLQQFNVDQNKAHVESEMNSESNAIKLEPEEKQIQEDSLLASQSVCSINGKEYSDFASIPNIPAFINNEEIWKRTVALSQLPLAIAEALWDHSSLNEDELTFASGEVIIVLFMEHEESWWWGTKNDGAKEGWFPAAYVRLRVVQELDDELSHTSQKDEQSDNGESQPQQQHSCTRNRGKGSFLSAMGFQSRTHKNTEHLMAVRAKCVEELLTTEKDYVKMLKNIIEGYLNKVRAEKNMFSITDAETIFGNIEELYQFHKEFLKELQQAIQFERMEESIVGHIFIKYKNRFEVYSKYCNNQPRSSARISSLTKEKKYEMFFETCRLRQNMIRLSLDGFLLSPVQRICKYPLQLKELLKHTSTEHEDYKTLNEARICMQNVAAVINERKRRLENVNKLARWQLTVSNWRDENIVAKSSDLLYKGPLLKINNGRECERYVYLFDHQLVYFLKEENKRQPLSYRGRIDLDTAIIENLGDNHVFIRGDTVPNVWRIWNKNKCKWCYFRTDCPEKKENWLKALENEREHVKEEEKQGFTVLPEVRQAAMESAYTKHIAGIKRGRMRRKSICTNHPELETTFASSPVLGPVNRQFSTPSFSGNSTLQSVSSPDDGTGPTVRKRTNKPKRKNSIRWSIGSTILEKYF